MSILPLRYRERYERIRPPPERTDWDAVFHRGDIDAYMAGALEEEVLSKGRKALVYVGREHSWVRYRRRFRVPGSGQWMEQAPSLGHRLSAAHPGRIASVLLHAPLQGAEGGELAPLGGEIEQMARSVGIPFAFDTSGQLGSLPVAESALSTGYDALRLRDLCDGYVVLGTLDSASGCTLDRGFYSRENLPEARRRWKDAARRPYLNTVEDLYRELEDP